MGGAVAIEAFASDRPPDADRLVLLAPAVWGWSTQPLINRVALWLAAHILRGHSARAAELRDRAHPGVATTSRSCAHGPRPADDLGRAAGHPLRPGEPDGARQPARGPGEGADCSISTEQHDEIIPEAATRTAVARLGPEARTGYYPNGWHLLLRDYEGRTVWSDMLSFLSNPAAPLPSGVGPIPGTRGVGAVIIGELVRRPGWA